MKAIVYRNYGSPDVLQYEEIEKPAPADNEVLIKVRAASLNALDWRVRSGSPFIVRIGTGLRKPKLAIPGVDVAGEVEAVGKSVTQFKPGDAVFGTARGSCAEFACAREDKLALKPASLSFEHVAALPVAAITALQGLRDHGHIQPGQKVLVDGASGGVGTFALQIAKSFGTEVTAVCSTRNVERARSLGADHVMVYTQEDFTESGQRYDLILAANAYHSIFDYKRALSTGGIFVMAGGGWPQMLQAFLLGAFLSLLGSKKLRFFMARIIQKDLVLLKDLLEAGKVTPVIDKLYGLRNVPEAFRYLEETHAQGKVVITL